MLVILVGLDGDTGQCGVAGDVIGLPQEAVTGGETALEQLHDVDLGAGGGQGIEIQVMDVDIAFGMGFGEYGIQHIHLAELLGALGAVFEHGAHGGVAVDVGVFTFYVVVGSGLKGQILVDAHQLGVHLTNTGTGRTVQDELFGGAGVTVFDQDFLNGILNLLNSRTGLAEGLFEVNEEEFLRPVHR